jgi:hypothetical protein
MAGPTRAGCRGMLAGVELVWTAKRDRNGDCATGQGGPAARRRVIRPASSRVTVSSVRKRSCTLCGIPNGPDIEFDLATGHWCNTFWAHCILAVGLGERCRVLATRVGPACDTICAGRWGLTAGTCMGQQRDDGAAVARTAARLHRDCAGDGETAMLLLAGAVGVESVWPASSRTARRGQM